MVRRVVQGGEEVMARHRGGWLAASLLGLCVGLVPCGAAAAAADELRRPLAAAPSPGAAEHAVSTWLDRTVECLLPMPEPSVDVDWLVSVRVGFSWQTTIRKFRKGGLAVEGRTSANGSVIDQARALADTASCEDLRARVKIESWAAAGDQCPALGPAVAEYAALRLPAVPNGALVLDAPSYEIRASTADGERFDFALTGARNAAGRSHPLIKWLEGPKMAAVRRCGKEP